MFRLADREVRMRIGRRGSLAVVQLVVAAVALFLWAAPAAAQNLPDKMMQEVLIKTTLLTFNDANVTGNYAVLQAKTSKQFRDQFPPERLKEIFKTFADQKIDIAVIAAKTPIPGKEAAIDDRGVLGLSGHFDMTPSQVHYDLGYVVSEGEWKPIKINVNVRPPDTR
jgi:hypothetical protein